MGLFIGASILTILELFDYLYEVMCPSSCVCIFHKSKILLLELMAFFPLTL